MGLQWDFNGNSSALSLSVYMNEGTDFIMCIINSLLPGIDIISGVEIYTGPSPLKNNNNSAKFI